MKPRKTPVKKLTVSLHVPVNPLLKKAVDDAAIEAGMPTNEWVSRALARVLGDSELGKIPRHRRGRPATRVAAAS